MVDPCGDVSGNDWWDVVGTETNPVAFAYNDGTDLWFRLRISDSPYNSTSWNQFGWGVLIESDWDETNPKYDYIVYVDGKTDEVTLAANTFGSIPFTTDPAEVDLQAWSAPLMASGSPTVGYAGYSLAGTNLCGGGRRLLCGLADFDCGFDVVDRDHGFDRTGLRRGYLGEHAPVQQGSGRLR